MRMRFIGTGQMSTKRRRCTSFVVDDKILFDIGSGTVAGLWDNGMEVDWIRAIVITHYHADNFGDILLFLYRRMQMSDASRGKPLAIIGPKGIHKKIVDYANFLFGDIRDHKNMADMMNVTFVEIQPGARAIVEEYEIQAIQVVHGRAIANGYIIKCNNRAIGYTGHACLTDGLMEHIREADAWAVDANDIMRVETRHMGFGEVIALADKYKKITFFAVNRGDYDISSNIQINLICPEDNDEYFVR